LSYRPIEPTIASRQPSSHISMQVPSRLMVTAAGGCSSFGKAYSQSCSWASATLATASATFWTKERATTRPWFCWRSSATRAEPNSAYLWASILAKRGVELTTMRAAWSSGQKVGPPFEPW
jgi:hypothetical protein